MIYVNEFKFKRGSSRVVKWTDGEGNENTIKKDDLISEEFSNAMVDLSNIIAFHLELPAGRVRAVGITRAKDEEGFDAYTLVGELWSDGIRDGNIVMAKKLEKATTNFFPAEKAYDCWLDEDGNIIPEDKVRLPEDHLEKLTVKEYEFCEHLLDLAGRYALGECEKEQPTFFDEDEDVEIREITDDEEEEE